MNFEEYRIVWSIWLKYFTPRKRILQFKSAHVHSWDSLLLRYAWQNCSKIFVPRFTWDSMASTLPICFLCLCYTTTVLISTSLRCCKWYCCFSWDDIICTNSHNRTCVVVIFLQSSKCVWGCSWRGNSIVETKLSFTDNKSVRCNCNCWNRRRGLPWDGHWCAVNEGDPKICRRHWESCIRGC